MCGPVQGTTLPTSATQVAGATGGGSTAAMPVTGGGGIADQLSAVITALRELATRLGGGAQAAVAGAAGDATGGGASAGVAQLDGPLPKGKVGGDAGPGQFPGQFPSQFPGQFPGQVGGKRGRGHHFAPGLGHGKHGHVVQQQPIAQVGGTTGAGVVQKPADKPVTQVGGDTGGSVDQAPVTQKPEDKPVTQVGGDTGGSVDQAPVTQAPVTQQPVEQAAPKVPYMGDDVRLLEIDGSVMQLLAKDGSYLFFDGSSVSFRSRTNQFKSFELPPGGASLTLSDGTKFSVGLTSSGTPRDLEVLAPDGGFLAARTDDGESTDWAQTPLTPFHLIEIASMLANREFGDFGSGGSKVVQQS